MNMLGILFLFYLNIILMKFSIVMNNNQVLNNKLWVYSTYKFLPRPIFQIEMFKLNN